MAQLLLQDIPQPPFCDDQGFGDSMLSHLESAALEAIADEVSHSGHEGSAAEILVEYVDYLRARGAPPEAMLICVKKLLARSAAGTLSPLQTAAYENRIISRCITAYYQSKQGNR